MIDNLASQEKNWVSTSETVHVCTKDLMLVPLGLKSDNQCAYKNHQVTHTAAPFASDWLGLQMQPLRLLRHWWRPLTSAPFNLSHGHHGRGRFCSLHSQSRNDSAFVFHTTPELVRCGLVNDHEYVGFPSWSLPMWIWCHLVQCRYSVVFYQQNVLSINLSTKRRYCT